MFKTVHTAAGGYGLRFKFIAFLSMLFILMGALLSWFFLDRTQKALEDELKLRGLSLAKNLAYNSTYGISIEDTSALERLIKGVSDEPDMVTAMVVGAEGRVLAHNNPAEVGKVLTDPLIGKALSSRLPEMEKTRASDGQTLYDIAAPVMLQAAAGGASEVIGTVRIGLSAKGLKEKLAKTLWFGLLITFAVIGVGVMISVFFVRLIVRPIEEMAAVAVSIAEGDFSQKVEVSSRDEVGVLGGAFGKMSDNLSEMIKQIYEVADNVAQASGRLNDGGKRMHDGTQVQANSTEAAASSIEQTNAAIKQIVETMGALSSSTEETSSSILEMSSSIGEVAKNAAGLAGAVDDTSSSIIEMAASIKQVAEAVTTLSSASDETVSAVNEINSTVREVEAHAKESALLSEQVTKEAQEMGVRSIEKTITGMNKIRETVVKSAEVIGRLGERSEQVGKILTVISEVTKQTNLLALNAAILAAQAGEQGKGFAVVADEMKNLAERTGTSTKEIAQLIANVQVEAKDAVETVRAGAKSVEEGVSLSMEAGHALKNILETSTRSAGMAREIERATGEQTRGIRQVTDAMQRISTMVQQISKAIQEQSRGTEQILMASEKMRDMTRQVKTSTEEQAKGSRQITEAVGHVAERVQHIAKAINEQKHGSEVIMKSVEEVRGISRESVGVVAELNKTVQDLARQAGHLKQSIGRFKMKA